MLISASEPYITSVVGQTVDLSVFSVMADSGIITPDEISWTSNGEKHLIVHTDRSGSLPHTRDDGGRYGDGNTYYLQI